MRILVAALAIVVGVFFIVGTNDAQDKGDKKQPKYTIKEVMKIAMAGGLCKKVATGKADDKEKAQLVELFTALSQNKPPMGDAAAWKERTGNLIKAAKDDDAAALKKFSNCASCHKEFKG
jgi:hypothetical protein